MNKLLFASTLVAAIFYGGSSEKYDYSTTSVVTMVGGRIAVDSTEQNSKYKRKDCPVCKGKGWYISGDGIAKIQCQYCEP